VLWLVLVATAKPAAAQVPNLVDVSAQYAPSTRFDDPRATEAQISSYQLGINLPLPLSARRFLIVGLAHHVDTAAYARMSDGLMDQRTFHATAVSATLVQLLPDRWSLLVRAGGSLASDVPSLDHRMIGYSAVALAAHRWSDRLTLGAGALVAAGFGSIRPLPAALVSWAPIDGVRVEAFLPAFVDARYTAWNRLELGVRAEITGNTYAVRDARVAARWPCAAQPTDDPATPADETRARSEACLDHVSYTVGSVGLVAGVRLASSIWLTAFGGIHVYRRFEEQNQNGDALAGGAHSLPATLMVRTSVVWRIPRT